MRGHWKVRLLEAGRLRSWEDGVRKIIDQQLGMETTKREFFRSSVGQNDTEQLKPFKKCGGATQRSLDDSRRRVAGIWWQQVSKILEVKEGERLFVMKC